MPKITRNVYDGQTGAGEDIGTDCCGNFLPHSLWICLFKSSRVQMQTRGRFN